MMQMSKKRLEYSISTHAIEKLFPSGDALRLCEQVSDGILEASDAVESILKKYGLKQIPPFG